MLKSKYYRHSIWNEQKFTFIIENPFPENGIKNNTAAMKANWLIKSHNDWCKCLHWLFIQNIVVKQRIEFYNNGYKSVAEKNVSNKTISCIIFQLSWIRLRWKCVGSALDYFSNFSGAFPVIDFLLGSGTPLEPITRAYTFLAKEKKNNFR